MRKMWHAAAALAVMGTLLAGEPFFDASAIGTMRAEAAKEQWVWIASDQKYGKFFAPSNVQVKSKVNDVATCISAWIKTVYTPGGAKETIDIYGIEASIPDPRSLAYSLAQVEVYPQERKVAYILENFYNTENKIIWSRVHEPPKEIEIYYDAFDEAYFVALVDQVFRHGEREQKDAPYRWKELWVSLGAGEITTTALADFASMRLAGNNLIYWEWQETKNKDGELLEVKFMKKALNYEQGTEKIVSGRMWTAATDWQDMDTDGRYVTIPKESHTYQGLERLRAIVKGYQYWLNRYRTDLPQAGNEKKDAKDQKSSK